MKVIIGTKYQSPKSMVIKKIGICSMTLTLLGSIEAMSVANGNQSENVSQASSRSSNAKFYHLNNYIDWLIHYNHTHENNWHSWKQEHLYDYADGLSRSQFNYIRYRLYHVNMWYYNYHYSDKQSVIKDNQYFNLSKYFRPKLIHLTHRGAYQTINNLFSSESGSHPSRYIHSRYDKLNNKVFAKYVGRLTLEQIKQLNYKYHLSDYIDKKNDKVVTDALTIKRQAKTNRVAPRVKTIPIQRYLSTHDLNEISQQNCGFADQMRADLINDINKSRIENGVAPVRVVDGAQTIADQRIPNVYYSSTHLNDANKYANQDGNEWDNWMHGVWNHTSASDYYRADGYGTQHCTGENASNIGTMYHTYIDNQPVSYNTSTPAGMARFMNDNMMYHDMAEGNNNGHRENELNPLYKYLGVGVHYNPQTQYGALVEDFSN